METINELVFAAAASPLVLLVMFVTAVIDGFFPPIPSETVLVAAAAAAASTSGLATLAPLCLAAAAGAMIGDNIAFAIGRAVGTTRFRWMRRPRVSAIFDSALQTLAHRGALLIFGARFIPVGRVVVNMSAGSLGYPWRRFLGLSALASATWAVYGAGIGVLAGNWLTQQPLLSAVLAVATAAAIGFVIDRVAAVRRRRAKSLTPDAPP